MSEPFNIPKAPIFPIALRYGVIVAGIGILFTIILFLLEMDTSSLAQVLGYLVLIGGMLAGILEYRDQANQGFINHGQVISVGVLIAVIAAFILGLFSIIYMQYINPEMMEQVILIQEEKFIEQGMSDDQIEKAISMMRKFSHPMFSIPFTVLWYAFVGLAVSAIAGFFVKKD
ncbi:MAG: DUF4199 domain-containing protein [Chitinophagales bacterium]